MELYTTKRYPEGKEFKCKNKHCSKYTTTKSIREAFFFSGFRIIIKTILEVIWPYSKEESLKTITKEVDCSTLTVIK